MCACERERDQKKWERENHPMMRRGKKQLRGNRRISVINVIKELWKINKIYGIDWFRKILIFEQKLLSKENTYSRNI